MPVTIHIPGQADQGAIVSLYRAVAAVPGGLARTVDEITPRYVAGFLGRSLDGGVVLVAREGTAGDIHGEIHASPPGPRVFSHVLGDLTLAVHPDAQGRGIGRRLVEALLDVVVRERPHITRVELVARESNVRAIALYRRLGFIEEGRLLGRIRSVGGGYEADVLMAWRRPGSGS